MCSACGGPWIQPNVHTNTIKFRRLIGLVNRRAGDHKCILAVEDKLTVQKAWLNLQDQNHCVRPSVWGCGRTGVNTSQSSLAVSFNSLLCFYFNPVCQSFDWKYSFLSARCSGTNLQQIPAMGSDEAGDLWSSWVRYAWTAHRDPISKQTVTCQATLYSDKATISTHGHILLPPSMR